jgi:hypothetical protein
VSSVPIPAPAAAADARDPHHATVAPSPMIMPSIRNQVN